MQVSSFITLLAVGLTAVSAESIAPRVVGGSETLIQQYPYSAALLYSRIIGSAYYQFECGATIIRNRAVMTAAHCVFGDLPGNWRIRVGSNFSNFGGIVYNTNVILVHPNYNIHTRDSDIAIIRIPTTFSFNPTVQQGAIAGATYNVADNTPLVAIGWGATRYQGQFSESLRHVQIWAVNQVVCRNRYSELGYALTDNMMCAGWLDVGGRDQCTGDNGSPVIHNNVIVGIRSFGQGCGLPRYPGVSTRISRFSAWVSANA